MRPPNAAASWVPCGCFIAGAISLLAGSLSKRRFSPPMRREGRRTRREASGVCLSARDFRCGRRAQMAGANSSLFPYKALRVYHG